MSLKNRFLRLYLKYWIKPHFNPNNPVEKQRVAYEKLFPDIPAPPHINVQSLLVGEMAAELIGSSSQVEGPIILYLHGGAM